MKKLIICTVCPRGCHIEVEGEGDSVSSVTGQGCRRGLEYATAEFAHPVRILTTTVKVAGNPRELLPVRSKTPLPRESLFDCMGQLKAAMATPPIKRYDVVIQNICGTGVDIVATKNVD